MNDQQIINDIKTAYKSLDDPNWNFVKIALDERPYQSLIQEVNQRFVVKEDTDPNYDVSFTYYLSKLWLTTFYCDYQWSADMLLF